MPVDNKHKAYRDTVEKWSLVRDIVNNDATKHVRNVDTQDTARNEQYKEDAILTNFTRLTKIGLTGLIFRKPSEMTLATELEYIKEDATGYGFGLEQLAHQISGEVLTTGRYGLLIDHPQGEGAAKFKPYVAESIINWKYKEVDGEYKLSLVVLKECIDGSDGSDVFAYEEQVQYRALMMVDGAYMQAVYNEELELVSTIVPVDYNGGAFQEIPFVFIGSENNDETMDTIPLYDLAIVNLGHYRNSADYEESIFISGQPYIVVNIGDGTSQEEFNAANPSGIKLGSRKGLVVGSGGSAQLLQANPNQLADVAMKRKEEQAAAIGARLIAPAGGRETAEAARIRFGSQNSALYTITKNIDGAIEKGLFFIAMFMMEVPVESEFNLNDQFYEETADPNMVASLLMGFDRGLLKDTEIRQNYREMGLRLDDNDDVTPVDPLEGTDNGIT